MSAQESLSFPANFDAVAEAAGGLAAIRELVLGLAIRGGLSRQEEGDDSSQSLLAGIRNAQKKAASLGAIDAVTPLTTIADDETPHRLAVGWSWARLSQVVMSIQIGPFGSLLHKSDYITGGTPLVNPANIRDGRIVPDAKKGVSRETLRRLDGYRMRANDVVMGRRGEMGKCAIVTGAEDGWLCGTGSLFVRPTEHVDPAFLAIWIRSPSVRRKLEAESVGSTMNNLNLRVLTSIVLAIPPLAEQKRIVAKVDQLMALCDELEARQARKRDISNRLTRAALEALTTADGPEEFDIAWTRVVENFDVLIDRSEKVGELRKVVLELAFAGRLYPRIAPTWPQRAIDEVATKVTDGDHATPRRTTSGNFLLSARNIRDGRILLTDVDFVPADEFARMRNRCDPNVGDVLISCSGSVGRVALVDRSNAYAMVRSAAMVRPRTDIIIAEYLHWALRSPLPQQQMIKLSKTSAQSNLFLGAIKQIRIPVPSIPQQRSLVESIEQLMKICDELEARLLRAEERAAKLAEAVVRELVS
jgi:type I restriction enzyme, S subunit